MLVTLMNSDVFVKTCV